MKDTGQHVQIEDSANEVAIKVEHVSKTFRLPHNRQNSIKGSLINLVSGGDRTYEKQEVLKDVSFEIKKGEFFGIVGRNGSGKSTLLKMLAGIYKPTAGNITVNGSLTPFIELGVGFNPELTGRENVFLNGALLGFSNKEVEAMYEDIVAFAELERFMDQKLKNYSSGMQVRLAFSIAIRAQSEILLLDEVLAVGDAAFQQKCYDYFKKLRDDKKTVILVTHDMSAIQRFCTRGVLIQNGEIKFCGTPTEVADLYLEKNIEASAVLNDDETKDDSADVLVAKIIEDDRKHAIVRFTTMTNQITPVYVGLTVFKNAVNIAEINSSAHTDAWKALTFVIDKKTLNPGIYEVSAVLFATENRKPLAVMKKKVKFLVKGKDLTRGSGMRLPDTWSLENLDE